MSAPFGLRAVPNLLTARQQRFTPWTFVSPYALGAGRADQDGSSPARCFLRELGRSPVEEVRQPVVRYRFPRCRRSEELTVGGTHSRVTVEGAEPDAQHLWVLRIPAEEGRAARRAEKLREAVRRLVGPDQLLAARDAQRSGNDTRLRRRGRACSPLAARAVAVARRNERLDDLEPDAAAETAPGEREISDASGTQPTRRCSCRSSSRGTRSP